MGYADEFFITVKSDECDKYYPNNTSSDFYCKLPYTLDLDGDWCVGVNQIWIDKMWYNMHGVEIQVTKNDGVSDIENSSVKTLQLEDGYYQDIQSLFKSLNTLCVSDGVVLCRFMYNTINCKATIQISAGYTVVMSERLRVILGMGEQVFTETIQGVRCVDLHAYDSLIHIHTNIVSGYMYSNIEPDIIKTMCTNRYKFGDVIYNNYLSDHTRVFMSLLDTIRVYITDKEDVIKQQGGSTVIQFHFKRE